VVIWVVEASLVVSQLEEADNKEEVVELVEVEEVAQIFLLSSFNR
jgi:hypothetical protein